MNDADHLLTSDVDLDHARRELAAGEQKASVRGEVHMVDAGARDDQRSVELHRVGVAEVEPVLPLGDHDRVAARRREVQVVRVAHRDRRTLWSSGDRADGDQAVADVVVDPERLQVVRGGYMLRKEADGIVGDDLERPLIDYVDSVACAVRDVDAWRRVSGDRAQRIGAVVCVDVDGETLSAALRPRSRPYRGRPRGG